MLKLKNLMKNIEKFALESSYKGVSIASVLLNKIARPLANNTFQKINGLIEVDEENSNKTLNSIKKTFKAGITMTHQVAVSPLEYFGNMVDNSQSEIEQKLKNEFGSNFNHWYFSRENIGTISNVLQIINFTTFEISHMGAFQPMKFLIIYTILQKIIRINRKSLLFGDKIEKLVYPPEYFGDIIKTAEECKFYCKFAHGCYGDLMNYVYSGKDITKIVSVKDNNEQFIHHTKIDPKDLIHSNWEATPYMPAHCITVSKERKEVLLCLRGSLNWADIVTDLVFTYLNFSVLEEENGKKFIKINYNMQAEKDLASSVQDTRNFNYYEEQKNEGQMKNKEIYKGLAHSGIFVAGIEMYRKLRPTLDVIFASLPKDYKLVVTGHSLGGGMTIMMILMLLIHPLKYFEGVDLRERIKGFTFGSPPTLSKQLEPLFEGFLINVVNQYDLVPRLNFGSIKDLMKLILEFEEMEKFNNKILKGISKFSYKEEKDMNADEKLQLRAYGDLYQHLKETQMRTIKLVHLGRTFVIEKQKKKKEEKEITYSFEEIKNFSYFNEIIFSKKMVEYHFPHLYEEGLNNKIIYEHPYL